MNNKLKLHRVKRKNKVLKSKIELYVAYNGSEMKFCEDNTTVDKMILKHSRYIQKKLNLKNGFYKKLIAEDSYFDRKTWDLVRRYKFLISENKI